MDQWSASCSHLPGRSGQVNNIAHQLPHHEGRQEPRTHLFVAATLYSDTGSAPVHIRNMSPSGALIEAGLLPEPGSRISLRRGQLHATGLIAWRSERRAGLRLDAIIDVPEWMSRGGSAGQQRVDAIVASCRGKPGRVTSLATAPLPVSIEVELALLRAELAELENALTEDAALVAAHPEIQTIDISLQRVERVLKRLRARE